MRRWAILASMVLTAGCGPIGPSYELDPRDEVATCDRNDGTAILRVDNRSTFDVLITIRPQDGGGRNLRPAALGLRETDYRIGRRNFGSGSSVVLTVVRGGMSNRPAVVYLGPIMCDVGTLTIAPVLSMSMFAGADI